MVVGAREYNDDYSGCARTYVSFHARHWTAATDEVTELLAIQPTAVIASRERGGPTPLAARPASWHIDTDGTSDSKDFQRHLDLVLAKLDGKDTVLETLRSHGWDMDISVYWESRHGHGGPALWPEQSARLGELGLEIWFDIYFHDGEDLDRPLTAGELTQNFRRLTRHWRRFGIPRRHPR